MAKSYSVLLDAMNYAKDFIESFEHDYEAACKVLDNAIRAARKLDNEEYFRLQRDARNAAIGDAQRAKNVREAIAGKREVKGTAVAHFSQEDVYWHAFLKIKCDAKRHRREKKMHDAFVQARKARFNHKTVVERPAVKAGGSDPVTAKSVVEFTPTKPFALEELYQKLGLHSAVVCPTTKHPMDAITAKEKFGFLYSVLVDMTKARAPKPEFVSSKEGLIVKSATPVYQNNWYEFQFPLTKGDIKFLAIDITRKFLSFKFHATTDKKWLAARSVAIRQQKIYAAYVKDLRHYEWSFMFLSSQFDQYMDEMEKAHPELAEDYAAYRAASEGQTRSDIYRETRLLNPGKKVKRKLDPYSQYAEETEDCVIFGGTDNELYELSLNAAVEGLLYCDCMKHPDWFPQENGADAFYVSDKEFKECLAFMGKAIYAESKSLKHELALEIALSEHNLESDNFDYDEEVRRQLNIKEMERIMKPITVRIDEHGNGNADDIYSKEEFEEIIKEEKALIGMRTKHPYDPHCLLAHFPSIDSRIINGTDCRIAYEQLVYAKNKYTKEYVFSDRERKLLLLYRKGFSFKQIAKIFPKEGVAADFANIANEFTRIWVKPVAQQWLRDWGQYGEMCADAKDEMYRALRGLTKDHTCRDRVQAVIDAHLARDEMKKAEKKAAKLTKKELAERKKLRDAHASLK